MSRPPTVEQLLVLADRAERGRLTAAEADRLRVGICRLSRARSAADGRLSAQVRRGRAAEARLRAVAALAASVGQQGSRAVSLFTLNVSLHASITPPASATGCELVDTAGRNMPPGKPLKASLAPERTEQVIR
ncbi:hypothetical protein ACFYM2_21270 [Streptomyces sp. NPDC006711]|uniref:hypothetical protein n=1 Tax=Streptomyces sp. NPDC006711 TaxID=3364762 RepID=UPI00368BA7D9